MSKKKKLAAIGRPRAIEQEQMVVSDGLMASMARPSKGGVYFLPVDEIVRKKGWHIYKEMLHDDQVKSCLEFKKILCVGRTWEIAPANDTPAAKDVADFVTYNLRKINFDAMAKEGMSALEFGYSLAEPVFTREQYEGKQMVTLAKVAYRDPQELYLNIDEHGNFLGVTQLAYGQNIAMDADQVFIFSHDKRFGNVYGNSDLRAAYRSWWAKKFIINFWNVYLERMGAPMTMMKYPLGSSTDMQEILKGILKNLGSKTEILVPEGVEIDLVEAKRSGNADYNASLLYHNNSIARAMLMAALFGTGGEAGANRGSDSQSFLQLRILFKMADAIARNYASEFMCQVVKRLVELNFSGDIDTIMPRFIWQDYGQFEGMKIADEIRQLHASGVIDMDQKDVNYARSVLGLPIRTEDDKPDKVIRPAALPPPGGGGPPPPPAAAGNTNADKGGSAEGDSTGDPNA